MDAYRKTWLILVIAALGLSLLSGYVYAGSGWHNGLLFLLVFIDLILLTRVPPDAANLDALRSFGPILMGIVLTAVLSAVGAACGMSAADVGPAAGSPLFYAIAVVFCGTAMGSVSVFMAVREGVQPLLNPLVTRIVLYFLLFIPGLAAVGMDDGSQGTVVAGYAAFCSLVALFFLWRSTRDAYSVRGRGCAQYYIKSNAVRESAGMPMDAGKTYNVRAVAVAAIVLAVVLGCFLDLNDGSLDNGGRTVRYVPTGSMDGDETDFAVHSFPAKTLVMIEKTDTIEGIGVGDVVAYRADGGATIVHRCVADHGDYLETKGDSNIASDSIHITDGNIVGEVVGTSHWEGVAVGFVKSSGILFVAMGCIIAVMVWTLRDMVFSVKGGKGGDGDEA